MSVDQIIVKLWAQGADSFARDMKSSAREVGKLSRNLLALTATANGLGALSAGGIGLVAALAPLSGVGASAGAGMLAFGTSMGLVKVAGLGVEASMKGVADQFARQTPVTRALAREVKGMVPELMHLKNVAQGRILAGVIDGLRIARPLLKIAAPLVARTSRVIGELARDAARLAVHMGGPLKRVMSTNVNLIRNVGKAGLNMGAVFIRVLDAARPLTAWLGRMTLALSESLRSSTNAATKNGGLAKFFDNTRIAVSRVARILGDLGGAFWNIGKIGKAQLGDSLLIKLVRGADALRKWTQSKSGIDRLNRAFTGARDILKGVEHFARRTAKAIGPEAVSTFRDLSAALKTMLGSGGGTTVLNAYAGGIALLAKAIRFIAQEVPGGDKALSGLFALLVVSRVTGINAFGLAFKGLAAAVRWFAGSMIWARIQMIAFMAKAFVMNTVLPLMATGFRLAWAAATGPVGLVVLAIAAVVAGLILAYKKVEWFRNVVDAVVGYVKEHWKGILSILTGPIGAAVIYIATHFGQIKDKVRSVIGFMRDKFGGAVSFIADRFRDLIAFFRRLPGAIKDAIASVPGIINDALGGIPGGVLDAAGGALGAVGLATGGTTTQAGWAVVGERGPELLRLPRASTVFDAQQTQAAIPANRPVTMQRTRAAGDTEGRIRVDFGDIALKLADETVGTATGRSVRVRMARSR